VRESVELYVSNASRKRLKRVRGRADLRRQRDRRVRQGLHQVMEIVLKTEMRHPIPTLTFAVALGNLPFTFSRS
jgi:hypothetical protein